ncbi:MAG: imidazole glycerol phosphate synthase subunit HisF [Bacteroidales bacterium]
MVAKRIIPCLDIRNGQTVKGINFEGLTEVGDPVQLAKKYTRDRADELVFLDITATLEGRNAFYELIKRIAKEINIPFTVGGGISSLEDAGAMLEAGADKITINSGAVKNPGIITEIANKYGSQFIIVAIDAKQIDNIWRVTTHSGQEISDRELFGWAIEAQERGAGEILFTSMDHDGTKQGYPIDVYKELNRILHIPVIASGGAGSVDDIEKVFLDGKADAALAASIFHYNEISIPQLKKELATNNINVRL